VFGLDIEANVLVLAVVSVLSSVIITLGYHNVTFATKTSLMSKREGKGAPGQKAQVISNTTIEATAFSVLFNNCVFLLVANVAGFFLFSGAAPVTNYILSVSLGSAVTTLATASQIH
jgi:hypothetical protein